MYELKTQQYIVANIMVKLSKELNFIWPKKPE